MGLGVPGKGFPGCLVEAELLLGQNFQGPWS